MIDLTITPQELTFSPNLKEIEKEYDSTESYDFHELIEFYLCNGLMTVQTYNVTNWLNNAHLLLTDGERVYYLPEYAVIDEVTELLINKKPLVFQYLCDFNEDFLEDWKKEERPIIEGLRPRSIEPVVPRTLFDEVDVELGKPEYLELILPTFAGTVEYKKFCQDLTEETGYGVITINVQWMELAPPYPDLKKVEEILNSKIAPNFYSDGSNLEYKIINDLEDIKKLSRKWEEFRFWDVNK